MSFQYFSKNGQLLPVGQALIPLSSIEYAYGYGVYETIRISGGVTYFLEDHFERLLNSAKIIGLDHTFSLEQLQTATAELVARTEAESYNLKVLLIGAPNPADATLYIQCLNPLFPDRKLYSQGAVCITYNYERLFPHSKSLNMLPSYLAYRDAQKAGAYDALLINRNGNITEGTRTNFFCLQGQTIITPPEAEILLGVTRKHVLNAALESGFTLEERNIPLGTVGNYDAAFITSTSSKIIPLRAIGDTIWDASIPAELKRLMKAFEQYLDAYKQRQQHSNGS